MNYLLEVANPQVILDFAFNEKQQIKTVNYDLSYNNYNVKGVYDVQNKTVLETIFSPYGIFDAKLDHKSRNKKEIILKSENMVLMIENCHFVNDLEELLL